MYVIRPFRPQDPTQLVVALTVRGLAPWVSAICAIVVLLVAARAWRRSGWMLRSTLGVLSLVAVTCAALTHVNIFEIMFHPYEAPAFGKLDTVPVDADDKVLAVTIHSEAHAYPIRTMGYHHIVNDTVGGTPIAVTYCTLCHTGLVWSRLLDERVLSFRLAGINNGNALMRDEQTSSIWQQSTGQAIFGPLKGRQLTLIHSDELTFALWRKEEPAGLVLKPDAPYASEYESKDWEKSIEKRPTVVDTSRSGIPPHELMLGVTGDGRSKAYSIQAVLAAKLIQDQVGDVPIVILVGPDQASIRVFATQAPDSSSSQSPTFVPIPSQDAAAKVGIMRDADTASIWNFRGCAVEGPRTGQCLKPVDSYKDFWFDWMNHHPRSAVFRG
jgi:hypothetical protein